MVITGCYTYQPATPVWCVSSDGNQCLLHIPFSSLKFYLDLMLNTDKILDVGIRIKPCMLD